MYSIKTRVVGFFHCRVCPGKTTCEHSKWHANGSLSHMHSMQPCSVPCHGTCLTGCDWSMCLRQVHARAGIVWRVHGDKELQELSVPPFTRLSSLITVILSPFLCLLLKRKIESTWFNFKTKPCTLACCWEVEACTDCMGMDILPECGHVSDHRSHLI